MYKFGFDMERSDLSFALQSSDALLVNLAQSIHVLRYILYICRQLPHLHQLDRGFVLKLIKKGNEVV
jgi:hypothetical protein